MFSIVVVIIGFQYKHWSLPVCSSLCFNCNDYSSPLSPISCHLRKWSSFIHRSKPRTFKVKPLKWAIASNNCHRSMKGAQFSNHHCVCSVRHLEYLIISHCQNNNNNNNRNINIGLIIFHICRNLCFFSFTLYLTQLCMLLWVFSFLHGHYCLQWPMEGLEQKT